MHQFAMCTIFVYTDLVKNITFSAEPDLIERARTRAREEKKTLNVAFREWLERYAGARRSATEFDRIMAQLSDVNAGRKFSREEMNERGSRR